jgi:hypothetical protein
VWTDDEGFKIKDERDVLTEIVELLSDGEPRTANEIRKPLKVGADRVREVIEEHSERFILVTGDEAVAVGKKHNAKAYRLAEVG